MKMVSMIEEYRLDCLYRMLSPKAVEKCSNIYKYISKNIDKYSN